MFSIVSMQDVLINLKGGETLFKMFDRPRSRQKNTSTKNLIGSHGSFPIKKVWVLPSHIITMVTAGNTEEIISYDQVPKLGSNKNEVFKLLDHDSTGGVFELHHTVVDSQEFVFIVLKTGQVHVWQFSKPEFEWRKVRDYALCKGRDPHIVSCVFDDKLNMFVWCERRSTTQFCICKMNLSFLAGTILFEESKAILHNCLPMNIYGLAKGHFAFIPISNKTLGLFLFWCDQDEKITVRMWGDGFNDFKYVAVTSDYQTIVRNCLYLWINRTSFENKVISLTTHPSSQELVVLQNDLNVYKVGISKDGHSVEAMLLCTLEEFPEGGEEFSKQIVSCYPIQRMLLLLMMDGTLNIFENKGGLFLWKTETFRNGAPQVWIRKGKYPVTGVWNRSGIWCLRSKPIADQLKEVLIKQNLISVSDDHQESSKSQKQPLEKVKDPDFALDVYEEQKKQQKPKTRKLKIKQGVNRSQDIPIHSIFSILDMWQLSNVSAETALSLSVRINELLKDADEEPNLAEVFCLIDEIKDPVLLLVLFGNKTFPFCVKKNLTNRLQYLLESRSTKRLDKEILSLLMQYLNAEHKVRSLFKEENIVPEKHSRNLTKHHDIVQSEMLKLDKFISQTSYHLSALDSILGMIIDLDEEKCVRYLLDMLIGKEVCVGTSFESDYEIEFSDAVKIEIWKVLIRHDSTIFTKLFTFLWQHEPKLIPVVMSTAQTIMAERANELFPIVFKVDDFFGRLWNLLFLPEVSDPNHEIKMKIYSDFCKLTGAVDLYDTFLRHQMVDEAFEILAHQDKNSSEHVSMFYQMVTFLLEQKLLGKYADQLSGLVPSHFKMAEFFNLYSVQAVELGKSSVFVSNNKEMSVGDVGFFLEQLL